MASANPNLPENLDIHPLVPAIDAEGTEQFDYDQQQRDISQFGIAGRVWGAAYLLIQYLVPIAEVTYEPLFAPSADGIRVVELGSGSGIVANTMSTRLRPDRDIMYSTDLPEVCPLLERNLRPHLQAHGGPILVRPLSWGNAEHASQLLKQLAPSNITHVLCSDLVYFPELLGPLLRSLIHLTSGTRDLGPQVIISYKYAVSRRRQPFGLPSDCGSLSSLCCTGHNLDLNGPGLATRCRILLLSSLQGAAMSRCHGCYPKTTTICYTGCSPEIVRPRAMIHSKLCY
ncbi:unnamed protein product [Mycena citricolor]|uniref:Uncharacterized protein n=1 Tax=Mycena citricolor TaxID=2018698 RepID=A0AAD2JZ79_9AGAR|nr:unnamed protein product [Mycena citricolor]